MNNLKKLRLAKGLSQQALADELITSQQTIYKYEKHIIEPNIEMLKNMADFFHVSVDYLIGYSSYAPKLEEIDTADLNHEEQSLVQKYRSLSPSTRQAFLQLLNEVTHDHLPMT